MMENEELL